MSNRVRTLRIQNTGSPDFVMNSNVKRNIFFSTICILVLISIFAIWYYTDQKKLAYKKIYLEFKETNEYEIDDEINPISLIKKTNAKDIEYPIIKPETVGEHTYVYTAKDEFGNRKEFVLKLKFVDPIKPVLVLTTNYVEITEGDSVDFNSFVKEAYDEVDGHLDVDVDIPNNLSVGEYEIVYKVSDKHKNVVTATLKLKVNPISKKQDNKTENDESFTKKDSETEKLDKEKQNTPQKDSVKIPSSKVFLISEYGSIANAEFSAKKYGQDNCPSNHMWYCRPYSDDEGIIIGYVVTFE